MIVKYNSSDTENRTHIGGIFFAKILIQARNQNDIWKPLQIIFHLSGRTSLYHYSFRNDNHLKSVTSFWINEILEIFSCPDFVRLILFSIIFKRRKVQVCATTHFEALEPWKSTCLIQIAIISERIKLETSACSGFQTLTKCFLME